MPIIHRTADLFTAASAAVEPTLILHVCNNIGAWGAGFSGALSARYPLAEHAYREHGAQARAHNQEAYLLGHTQFVTISPRLTVGNMIAQRGIADWSDLFNPPSGLPPIQYPALSVCLSEAADYALDHAITTVLLPRIGSGLAGGDWTQILPLIEGAFDSLDAIQTIIFTLPSAAN